MSVIIAGDRSGSGKTTLALAILAYMARRGDRVQAFKVGPDYIDPGFHSAIAKRPSRNLDPVLTSEDYVRQCFFRNCRNVEYALVEGVMGLFDGIVWNEQTDFASTAHIARLLGIPVVLTLDCRRLSGSIAAITCGFRDFDPQVRLAGVVLNQVGSDRHRELLSEALVATNVPILGTWHRNDEIGLRDRHLGLVPADEHPDLRSLCDRLSTLASDRFDWERLLPLLVVNQPTGEVPESKLSVEAGTPVRIGIARDRAFNFYYRDNLELLEMFGATLVFWSPLSDRQLPENLHGLYFGGGFPEVFAAKLASNCSVLGAVKQVVSAGIPTYSECGGLMYLCAEIVDLAGETWPMVGLLPTAATMSAQLILGYRQAIAQQNSILVRAGETLIGHEFHRSQLTAAPRSPLFSACGFSPKAVPMGEGWTLAHLHASYIHLHWGANPLFARRFVGQCRAFAKRNLL